MKGATSERGAGLVHWGDHMGPAYVCERLEACSRSAPASSGRAYLKGHGRKLSAGAMAASRL